MSKRAGLQITKAVCGTRDSSRDVTAWVRDQVRRNKLSLRLTQPFREIGGDPATGRRKKLVVNYRFGGNPRRLSQLEQYPIAFELELPPQGKSVSAREADRLLRGKTVKRCFRRGPSNLRVQFDDGTILDLRNRGQHLTATVSHGLQSRSSPA